jgi:hypothetical protein
VFAAEVTSVPIALAMVGALALFAACLPSMIKDSRRPPRHRAARPVVVREPRPVRPARQIVLPLFGGAPAGRAAGAVREPSHPRTPANPRVTFAVATFVLLSLWSARSARSHQTARR